MRTDLLLLLLTIISSHMVYADDSYGITKKWPTIGVSILVRNKADSLPYVLTCLRQLDYPKKRMFLWIHSDHNEDKSIEILEAWTNRHGQEYQKIHLFMDRNTDGQSFYDQTNPAEWSQQRFKHVIKLREEALQYAKDSWADFLFMVDADAFLTNPKTLKSLVLKNVPVVAPMLITDGLYSNFWGGMTKEFYYKRTDDYEGIIKRKTVGCFEVPMVHSAVLIDLRSELTDALTYDPVKLKGKPPLDDIITFALSAKDHDIKLSVCNDEIYGFLPIPVDEELVEEKDQIDNMILEALGRGITLPIEEPMRKHLSFPPKTKSGLDEIFLINLEKRMERKNLMQNSFDVLGLQVKLVNAVDGKKLTEKDLKSIGRMPNYEDPYHKRPMKSGEIGCFLSHFAVWTEIARRSLKSSLILEDDIHFVPYFRRHLDQLMDELGKLDWDFVYIGRKVLMDSDEELVSAHIAKPLYSYWTLGYLISESGARKLIKAEPLAKMLPVDEFLPIMFDQHPNATWKAMFSNRNLKAYSASPLLVHPTHYTGEEGYISDTEDSPVAATADEPDREKRYLNEL